ncbi:MAG: peptidoglycan DD-metalloendopeptidase family protein [Chloroflexi bacterium]|nr:peptidoglycan DD-metalloendopeptidase family protein [Chloroflexota bacterium]
MTQASRRIPIVRLLPWIVLAGLLIGAGVFFGEEILRFVTGQDIQEELLSELEQFSATSTPSFDPGTDNSAEDQPAAPPTLPDPFQSEEIAPDGFPVDPRQHVYRYVVAPGDALFLIADRFNLDPNTIFWSNTETLQDNVHLIYEGLELYILPTDGVYHLSDGTLSIAEIAALYGVTVGEILYSPYNRLAEFSGDDIPDEGLRVVIPNGRREYISWRAPIQTGSVSGETNPEGTIHPGSCRQQYTGTGGTGTYLNPMGATPYRVTQGFAPWHPGVDLAADRDTPLYASETGVVVFAGFHRQGYGELVILDHGEGWTTYYAHLDTRFVGCGDQISRGQLVGLMGSTGNSTGLHLHFEIRENDIPQNPYNFFDIQDVRETNSN